MKKVTVLGSGNWGSVIAKIIATNVMNLDNFDKRVNMWVFEEIIEGRKLTEIINERHENIKYLPNIKLPSNVIAVPDIVESVKGSNLLVFVIPHQFIKKALDSLKGKIEEDTLGISLIKGIEFDEKKDKPILISHMISRELKIPMSVLMGANIANEIAEEKFSETTIGTHDLDLANQFWKPIFHTPYFRVNCIDEVFGVEVCGSVKNVIALAAGICDGLGEGSNTKSAFIRIGIDEMRKFIRFFNKSVNEHVYFESCGIADVLTTCLSGRNRKFAMEYAKRGNNVDIKALEKEVLKGQQLQGLGTLEGVYSIIEHNHLHNRFPLFVTLYKIFFQGANVRSIFQF